MLEQYIPNLYLRSIALLIAIFIVVRSLMYLFEKILPFFTKKTKTNLDDIIVKKASVPITLIVLLVSVRFMLGEFNLAESAITTLNGILSTLIILIGSFLLYVLLDSLIMVGLGGLVSRTKSKLDDSLLLFIHSILQATIIVSAFLLILSTWGIEIGPLLAGLGIAGIAIAFALQAPLSNIFGGISLLLDRSIKVGDVVNLDAQTNGKILRIGLRSTKIKTFDNELIIVPNSKLADSNIQNVALPEPKTRVVIPFGVAYGADINKVKKTILKEIKKIPNTLDDPAPVVRFLEMADSSLNFKAYFYVDSFEHRLESLDLGNELIYNALNKNKIEIPFPQIDVHLKKK